MKYIIWIVVILLVIWGGFTLFSDQEPVSDDPITIGVILPLSGPAAIWGETMQQGIELALEELKGEGTIINVIYEDSQALPTLGVSAYNKLVSIDDADVIFSMFSRVGVPLVPLADRDGVPLIMTLIAANEVASGSPFAFRYFATPQQYARTPFEFIEDGDNISVLYVNDEYGVSVRDAVRTVAEERSINIVREEKYEAGETDFRTQLTKIKGDNPDVLIAITATPPEITSAINQTKELQINAAVVEAATLLSASPILASVGTSAEGAVTNAYDFSLGLSGNSVRELYEIKHGETNPMFTVAIGYDLVRLVAEISGGEKLSGERLASKISKLRKFDSAIGKIKFNENGEMNPDLSPAKIIDGELVGI